MRIIQNCKKCKTEQISKHVWRSLNEFHEADLEELDEPEFAHVLDSDCGNAVTYRLESTIQAIFYNNSGMTLKLGPWTRHYAAGHEGEAVKDYWQFIEDSNTDAWEVHPWTAETTSDIRYLNAEDIQMAADDLHFESDWQNIQNFIAALR